MSPQATKDKDATQDADLERDAPPLAEQENPTVFDGDIEQLNEDVPPLSEQESPKLELGDGYHKTSATFGLVYSDYDTDGAGHGPSDFAPADDDDDDDNGGTGGSAVGGKPGKGPKSRAAKK